MNQPFCYIGVDVGLTAVKAGAFDAAGRELAGVTNRTPRSVPAPRVHVVDMERLGELVLDLLKELADIVVAQGYTPAGIGVTGHGNGLYPVDDTLKPVGSAIASSDSRAQYLVSELSPADCDRLRKQTGSIAWAAQPAVLLRWLRDNDADAYTRTRWLLSCKDWVTSRLTGQVSADFSDASACGLVDLESREYTAGALEVLGLSAAEVDRFPELSPSGRIVSHTTQEVSRRTGLPPGLPVVAGCMDCVAAVLGTGANEPGDVTVIAGTWAINAVVGEARLPAPAVTLSALLPEPTRMLSMEVSPTSAANVDWLGYALAAAGSNEPVAAQELLEDAAAAPPGADGLFFLPFVNGAPEHPSASGTFIGLRALHHRGHLARAVLEGVTQYHRRQLDRVLATGMVVPDRPWRLAGGGAKSALWAQIFADVLGRPLQRHRTSELGARGVASLLPGAVGHAVADWNSATGAERLVEPGENHEIYQAHGRSFDRLLESLVPTWELLEAGGGEAGP